MNTWDIILTAAIGAAVAIAAISRLRRRKKGCGCGCENCVPQNGTQCERKQ